MMRRVFLILLAFLFVVVPILGSELPQVSQPNTAAYTPAEIGQLKQALTALESFLAQSRFGSSRTFAANDWLSDDFAAYSAGVLTESGYLAQLVSQGGWFDGAHTWILVGLPLDGKTAWIPVEASPRMGQSQPILGYVPSYSDTQGTLWFETAYTAFEQASKLPANLPPVAGIRQPASLISVDRWVKFLGLSSYDPDGDIILYLWELGDGTHLTEVDVDGSIRHRYTKAGTYTVGLTVIDNRGKQATTSISLRVVAPNNDEERSERGCGCGG